MVAAGRVSLAPTIPFIDVERSVCVGRCVPGGVRSMRKLAGRRDDKESLSWPRRQPYAGGAIFFGSEISLSELQPA